MTFNVKWLDSNNWSTWLEKSGNFICLESGNHETQTRRIWVKLNDLLCFN